MDAPPNQPNQPKMFRQSRMVKKSPDWTVRVDDVSGVRTLLPEWLHKYGGVLCVREEADDDTPNPHYHIALRLPVSVTQETLRNYVKKLGVSGSDYQTKIWTAEEQDNKFLRYCCKGSNWAQVKRDAKTAVKPPDVIFKQLLGLTIEELHKDFWEQNRAKFEELQKTKPTREYLVDETVKHVRKECSTDDTWGRKCESATYYLMNIFKGKINDHVLFPILQSAMFILDHKTTSATAHQRMLKKFSNY